VPSQPGDLLSLGAVAAECEAADRRAAAPPGTAAALLASLAPGVPAGRHPHDLSEGQRLALALAVQLAARPDAVLLDEPTRGLDYLAKARLAAQLRSLADQGRAVLVVTHDVEFAAEVADDVLIMAGGRLIASGPAAHVLAASPAYAPQVAKALAPLPYLTVGQVRAALGVAGPAGPPAPTDPVGTTAPAVPRDAPVQGGGAR
jgi:energy-coupling factor transport system ATP-binding protein